MEVPNALRLVCQILNSHISATGDPIHFMFGSIGVGRSQCLQYRVHMLFIMAKYT